jgi:hypothetical protein
MSLRFIPTGTPSENGDGLPSVNILNDVDEEENYDICNGMDSSSEHAAHGYDSDPEEDIPDGVSHARAFNHIVDWSNSSSEDEEEEAEEEEQIVAKKDHKYEYYDQKDFPASPDDAAHVFLADLCRRIRAPLYAYDEILQWAQEAHLSGYRFPTNAPTYRYLISSLRSRLSLSHLSHGTATIQKCGGGTLDFPVFEFESMFYDLIDDYRISPHLLINVDCPNKPPVFNSQYLDEVHSGKWHRLTSQQLLQDPNDVLCGIIFFRSHSCLQQAKALCAPIDVLPIHHPPLASKSALCLEAPGLLSQVTVCQENRTEH